MSQITRPEQETASPVCCDVVGVRANEKVRSIFPNKNHVLRLYYRWSALSVAKKEEELETKLYNNFFLPLCLCASKRIHFAAFNNLILTGTNNFART